ncbi:hypothetical protein EEB12_26660 [Rhodococcus sp. WS1]|nr:hypothetical protein [Rhodococcus erythropolis]ROZ53512.1 hypothetical protein EEB12_26660 [Rhodococcus sp. WS1]
MTKIKIEITLEIDEAEWMQRQHVDIDEVRSSVQYRIHELVSDYISGGDFGFVSRSTHTHPKPRPLGRGR